MIGGFTDLGLWIVASAFLIPAAIIAIPAHEIGHGLAAYWLGDVSVRNRGFLRPQLRRFVEPYGAVAVFLANVGWGQSVPVNMSRLDTLRRRLLYHFGGPVANLVLAVASGVALRLLVNLGALPNPIIPSPLGLFAWAVYAIFFLNLSFAVFNLLPIPGLDGWRVIEDLFRRRNPRFFFDVSVRQREVWVGIVLVIFVASFVARINLLAAVMAPFFTPLSVLLIGQCIGYISLPACLR